MRTMVRVTIPTTTGNRAIADGTVGKIMQGAAERWHPEAMYFTTFDGQRTAYMVIDLADPSDIPSLAEPFFSELDAGIELLPVMNTEDLQKGLARLG